MSASRKNAWFKFLKEEDAVEEQTTEIVDNTVNEEPEVYTESVSDTVVNTKPNIAPVQPKLMNMKRFTLQFSGAIDVDMIANSMKLILGDKAEGELEIICYLA